MDIMDRHSELLKASRLPKFSGLSIGVLLVLFPLHIAQDDPEYKIQVRSINVIGRSDLFCLINERTKLITWALYTTKKRTKNKELARAMAGFDLVVVVSLLCS